MFASIKSLLQGNNQVIGICRPIIQVFESNVRGFASKPMKKKSVLLAEKRKWKIISGDTVSVINGPKTEIGKVGKVLKVHRAHDAVVVEAVNIRRKTVVDDYGRESEVDVESPIPYSNVSLIDPKDNFPCRVRYGFLADGTKVRMSARSGTVIPFPKLTYTRSTRLGPKDTPADSVLRKTYEGR